MNTDSTSWYVLTSAKRASIRKYKLHVFWFLCRDQMKLIFFHKNCGKLRWSAVKVKVRVISFKMCKSSLILQVKLYIKCILLCFFITAVSAEHNSVRKYIDNSNGQNSIAMYAYIAYIAYMHSYWQFRVPKSKHFIYLIESNFFR